MAGHLQNAGYNVTVFNRTREKEERWLTQYQGKNAISLAEAVKNAEVVITCIGNDKDLLNLFLHKEGIFNLLKPNTLVIDHTTASADTAIQLYKEGQKKQIHFIDAPVSGGQQGAKNGKLTIMLGGSDASVQKAIQIIEPYTKAATAMGKAGNGQLTKMVNQITIAGLIQSLSEGLAFAEKAELDQRKVIDVISKGAAQSWQMDNRADTMIKGNYDHGFAVDLMRKDLAICLKQASSLGTSIPVAALVDQFYTDVQQMGGNRWDTSSLLARLKAFKK